MNEISELFGINPPNDPPLTESQQKRQAMIDAMQLAAAAQVKLADLANDYHRISAGVVKVTDRQEIEAYKIVEGVNIPLGYKMISAVLANGTEVVLWGDYDDLTRAEVAGENVPVNQNSLLQRIWKQAIGDVPNN